jgi:hypothetical protein
MTSAVKIVVAPTVGVNMIAEGVADKSTPLKVAVLPIALTVGE